MLDIKFIAENKDLVKKLCEIKNVDLNVDELLGLYEKIKEQDKIYQSLSAEKNQISKQFSSISDPAAKQDLGVRSQEITKNLKTIKDQLDQDRDIFQERMWMVPNVISSEVPLGKDDEDNVEIKRLGDLPKFDFEPKDHISILLQNNWADFDSASAICGTRSYALKNEMVLLERAIQQLAIDKLMEKKFEIFSFPSIVKENTLYGTGHFPASKDDIYRIDDDYLSGTAEVQLNSIHAGQILNENDLPKLYAGFSSCFRKEAGSHGKDVKGLVRVHQFTKVEQYVICRADLVEAEKMHQFLLRNAEEVLEDLELPYRVIECCTGDMGLGKYRMYDVEAWVPTQNKYRETHSCSNLTDWQARRTNIRYRCKDGTLKFVYTLNNTAIATPRVLVPFIENHQTKDGHITIPKALRKYLNNREIL